MIKLKIPSRFRINVVLLRNVKGSYVDGKWIEGSEQQQNISVSWQPLTPSDYRLLPEGESPSGVYKVFWNNQFQFGSDGGLPSDRIIKDDIQYKLLAYHDWIHGGFSSAIFKEIK